ncbi:MAG TPA: PilZ domain-containing protein [Tepidiformaceae bacterium]|nr:PilZ domain-containing protein [Tepidiformaceae bacterium]
MSAVPQPGTALVVIQRSDPPRQWQGELVAFKDRTFAVRIIDSPKDWDATVPYAIIWGTPGARTLCNVTLVASKDSAIALRLASQPKAIDLRRDPRFNLDLSVEVRSVLGNSRQPGRIIDVSSGGAAVSVDAKPGGSQIEVGVFANGYAARLLCDVVNTSTAEDQTILHLQFRDLTPPQQAFVRTLVGNLVESQAS